MVITSHYYQPNLTEDTSADHVEHEYLSTTFLLIVLRQKTAIKASQP